MGVNLIWAALGLTIFLIAIRVMSRALREAAGERLQRFLAALTVNPLAGLVTGAAATAAVQSSSAVAATMVALVNSRLLTLEQAFGVILGANIGTTLTAHLTAQVITLSPYDWAMPLMVLGLAVAFWGRGRSAGRLGIALFAFGALFLGISYLTRGLRPVAAEPVFRNVLAAFAANRFLGILAGLVSTGIVQSSSAVTGLTVALAAEGALSLPAAVAVALGSNIGTVVTTLLASIGTSAEARRTACADLVFNTLGVLLLIPIFSPFVSLVEITSGTVEQQVANAHTIFNVLTALVAVPLIRPLAGLVRKVVSSEYPT